MKSLNSYLTENDGTVKNKKFLTLMKKAGLEKVLLCKGDGYFYITSDDDEWAYEIMGMYENAIYLNSFNHQTPEQWVEDIKNMLKGTNLVKEGLLAGQDNMMKTGDDYVETLKNIEKEFKTLQKLKVKDWVWTSNEAQYYWNCPAFIKHTLGIDADHIIFAVTPYEDADGDNWTPEIDMYMWRKQSDTVSNAFSIVVDRNFYKNYDRMLSGVSKQIKKTFVISDLDWFKTQFLKRINVNIFKN